MIWNNIPATVIVNIFGKLLGFSLVLGLFDLTVPTLYFSNSTIALTVLLLTVTGAIADLTLVPRLGNEKSLGLGLPAITLIIWTVAKALPNNHVTWGWSLIMAVFIGPIEYLLHRFVLKKLVR